MDRPDERSDLFDVVSAAALWAKSFGSAPLRVADADRLVESALRITDIVARAARQLTWQTPDSFIAVSRHAELADD
jgi:hypothetical protein